AEGTDDEAQEIVDAGAEHDVIAPDIVPPRQRLAQDEALWITVPVDLRRGGAHRGERLGRGAEGALIGADAELERTPRLALESLGRDEGNGGGERRHQPRVTRPRRARHGSRGLPEGGRGPVAQLRSWAAERSPAVVPTAALAAGGAT